MWVVLTQYPYEKSLSDSEFENEEELLIKSIPDWVRATSLEDTEMIGLDESKDDLD